VVVSIRELVGVLMGLDDGRPAHSVHSNSRLARFMEPASPGMHTLPQDVLIVEDDPIIALDFEDTILGLGVKTVRTAAGVARALQMIADRAPDFALLDVSLVREKASRSPSGSTRWASRSHSSPATAPMSSFRKSFRSGRGY
jgi:hypothetical protein